MSRRSKSPILTLVVVVVHWVNSLPRGSESDILYAGITLSAAYIIICVFSNTLRTCTCQPLVGMPNIPR